MSYDNTVRNQVFTRLGLYVDWWYKLDEMKGLLDGALDSAIGKFGLSGAPSVQDKAAYEALSAEIHKQKDELSSLRTSVAYKATEFIGVNVKALLDSPHSTPEAILDHLIDAMGDYETGDHVLSNTTIISEKAEDEDNSVQGMVAAFAPTITQMARSDQFALTCIDDSICNQERWQLESARLGQYSTDIITGQAANWVEAGIENITLPTTSVRVIQGSEKLSAISVPVAQRGVNVGSDGSAWLKFNDSQAMDITNDPLAQLIDFDLSNVVFGHDTDIDGKLYVSVVKEPAEIEILGGVQAELADPVIIGASQGILYATVEKADGPTYTVTLYSDSNRQNEIASGESSALGTITFSDGLTGHVILSAFNGPAGTDDTIALKLPVYAVRLYRAAGASPSDLVSQGFASGPTSSVPLAPLPGFSTQGSVALNYMQDSADIVLTWPFYTIDVYRADPATYGEEFIVARAGSIVNLLTSSCSALPCYEANGSGLTGMSLSLTNQPEDSGFTAKIGLGYRKGDTLTFKTTSEDEGRFQTFCRENFAKVLPASKNYIIREQWAGAESTLRLSSLMWVLPSTGLTFSVTGGVNSCLWDFGDQTTDEGEAVSHTYNIASQDTTATMTAVDCGADKLTLMGPMIRMQSLDCSGMKGLKEIVAIDGALRAIPTGCPDLETFVVGDTLLGQADFSLLPSLTTLKFEHILEMPVVNLLLLTKLQYLSIYFCSTSTTLDFSPSSQLTRLECIHDNTLNTLDVSDLTALTHLDCNGSANLMTITLPNPCKLTYLDCNGTSIDRNAVLDGLADGSVENGLVDVSNNSGPALNSVGLAAINLLRNTLHWTVNGV